jgi:hypothetical protein
MLSALMKQPAHVAQLCILPHGHTIRGRDRNRRDQMVHRRLRHSFQSRRDTGASEYVWPFRRRLRLTARIDLLHLSCLGCVRSLMVRGITLDGGGLSIRRHHGQLRISVTVEHTPRFQGPTWLDDHYDVNNLCAGEWNWVLISGSADAGWRSTYTTALYSATIFGDSVLALSRKSSCIGSSGRLVLNRASER